MNSSSRQARAIGAGMLGAGTMLVAIPLFVIGGPLAETKFLPVLTDIEITEGARSADGIGLHIVGVKSRACVYEDIGALVHFGGTWIRADVKLPPRRGSVTRATGQQDFGVWMIEPAGDRVVIELRHQCHPLWDTTTRLHWERRP